MQGNLLFQATAWQVLWQTLQGNAVAQEDVSKCMENARQVNTAWKKIAWAEENPPLCLCDWILCIVTLFLKF